MMPEKISVIIPARNEARNIGGCLDAVFRQKCDYHIEAIVIDSGSEDDTVAIAERAGARVMRIAAADFDHGGTRNLGFQNSTGKYLVALVADATPADENWLARLIAPLEEDESVAGAYSRHVPPPDLHPLASGRFAGMEPARLSSEVRQWPGDEAWERLDPLDKLGLVEFDDVSSVRRRSVWERIPVAENYWAEDVDWSLKAMRSGHKIAYAADSVVIHGHKPSLRHDFKRAYVDQREARRRFGIILHANPREAFDSWLRRVAMDFGALSRSDLGVADKTYWAAAGPLRRFLEIYGGYLAGREKLEDDVILDLFARFILTSRRGDLRKTVFSLGGRRCNTVFAHPPSRWSLKIKPKRDSFLEFFCGVHPDVHDKTGPISFAVLVDGKETWRVDMSPREMDEDRVWRPGRVDLNPWAGKRVEVALVTEAEDLDHAWAGWGSPRVLGRGGSAMYRINSAAGDWVEKTLTRTPPRHP